MPDGGYGLNHEDGERLKAFKRASLKDPLLKHMSFEWVWAYVSARAAGATPKEAATAAYVEWDL